MLVYLPTTNSIDFILGDFKYDLSKASSNKPINHMIEYTQVVNEPTHISESKNRCCLHKEYFVRRGS